MKSNVSVAYLLLFVTCNPSEDCLFLHQGFVHTIAVKNAKHYLCVVNNLTDFFLHEDLPWSVCE